MHGSVFLDAKGKVVRPALLWNDQRTVAEAAEIEEKAGGREGLVRLVANRALVGFTAPKVLWLRNHEPANWDRVRQVLLPKDYIRFKLSGTYATEVSDAAGTLFLDVANRRWSQELLGLLDLDPALLPECFESFEVSSVVSAVGAEATGLKAGTKIVGGGGDQPAGAVGNGIVRAGVVSATMGTSGVVFAHAPEPGFDPLGRLQRGCHAVPGAWCVMGVVLSAGGSFQWYRNQLGQAQVDAAKAQGIDPYFLLNDEAALAGPGAEGLFFLPYLTGERAPYYDSDAKGALDRPDGPPRPASPGPEHPGRGLLRDARQPRTDPRDGREHRADPGLRRRGPEPVLEADPGRHLRRGRPHRQRHRRPGLRRRPAGDGRRRGLRQRPRGLRRHDPAGRPDQGRARRQGLPRPGLRDLPEALPGPPRVVRARSATSSGAEPTSPRPETIPWPVDASPVEPGRPSLARSRARSRRPPAALDPAGVALAVVLLLAVHAAWRSTASCRRTRRSTRSPTCRPG